MTTRDRLRRIPGLFAWHACQGCRSLVLNPLPTQAQAMSFYEDEYLFERVLSPMTTTVSGLWNRLEWSLFYRRWFLNDAKRIGKLVGSRSIRLLDVGCGSGLRLKVFREEGILAEGTEVSERFLHYATKSLGVPVRKITLEELHRSGEQFDVVTLYSVLEHIPEPRAFMKLALRLIHPGGFLVIRVPVNNALLVRLLGVRHCALSEVPRHTWIPSAEGLVRELEREGAKPVARVPTGPLVLAADFAISVYPMSSTPLATHKSPTRYIWRRALGGALICLGMPLALWEHLSGVGSEMDFFFRVRSPLGPSD